VQTPKEEPTVIDAVTQRLLSDTLTLANQLGATVFTFKGADVADTICRFAREYRVGQIVIGKPHPIPWWRRLLGRKSVAEQLVFRAKNATVVVVDADSEEQLASELPVAPASDSVPEIRATAKPLALRDLLDLQHIKIWEDPVSRQQVLHNLSRMAVNGASGVDPETVVRKLAEREEQGSTFLNEGVALPHARLEELTAPRLAIGLTHGGVLDAPTDKPVEVVVLLLSPAKGPASHLQLLAAAGRSLQKKDVRAQLRDAKTPEQALEVLRA
jgi:two-component system sensor histidine kinase KdpD